jgi:hypothetical protein
VKSWACRAVLACSLALPSCLTSKVLDPQSPLLDPDRTYTPSGSFGKDEIPEAVATTFAPCIVAGAVVVVALALDLVTFPVQYLVGCEPFDD